MSDAWAQWSAAFTGATIDAMRVYDQIVARLFTPWARDLIDRLAPQPGAVGLDVACGPGTVAHVLAERLGPAGRVVATDLSPAMLDIARTKTTPADAAPIEWIEAPAESLPVPDASVDVITCQQGLQFFPDKTAALADMRRALRDGGIAGVSIWTTIEDQGLLCALHDAVGASVSPEVGLRYEGPFLLTGEEAAEHARAAGFGSVHLERVTLPAVIHGGPAELVASLAASGIAPDIAVLDGAGRDALLKETARRVEPYRDGDALRASLTASVLTLS